MAEDSARETVAISSCARGYHVYKDRWKPRIGEKLACVRESANIKDRYAVAVVKKQDHVDKKTTKKKKSDSEESIIVGHLPRKISCVCSLFIRRGGTITCKVSGRRHSADLLQGGLEIPCQLIFEGKKEDIEKLTSRLHK